MKVRTEYVKGIGDAIFYALTCWLFYNPEFQIFGSVVVANTVLMVNVLVLSKWTTKNFAHYKNVLSYRSVLLSVGVVSSTDIAIAIALMITPALLGAYRSGLAIEPDSAVMKVAIAESVVMTFAAYDRTASVRSSFAELPTSKRVSVSCESSVVQRTVALPVGRTFTILNAAKETRFH